MTLRTDRRKKWYFLGGAITGHKNSLPRKIISLQKVEWASLIITFLFDMVFGEVDPPFIEDF